MRIRRNGYKIRLPGRIAVQGAPPLDIFHPTRQKRALGTPDRAELVGWLDQHLLARFARLARYAVAQRVQNSRFGPHNGLKMRPTYVLDTTLTTRANRCRLEGDRRPQSGRQRSRSRLN